MIGSNRGQSCYPLRVLRCIALHGLGWVGFLASGVAMFSIVATAMAVYEPRTYHPHASMQLFRIPSG